MASPQQYLRYVTDAVSLVDIPGYNTIHKTSDRTGAASSVNNGNNINLLAYRNQGTLQRKIMALVILL